MTAATPHQGTATMLQFAAVAALLATSLSTAHAQAYPSKPIRLMIGYTAGGSAEAGARPLARALEPLLGQPLVFEYRPGNAGGVAMEAIARAPNDGYSLYYFDSGPLTVAPHLGKVRALAVTSLKRSAAFPDVPTMDELGLKGFDSTAWYGVLGPAGLPQKVVARWTQALAKAGADKNLLDQINATGCDAEILPPAKTIDKIKADYEKWGRVVKEAGIKAE